MIYYEISPEILTARWKSATSILPGSHQLIDVRGKPARL